MKLVRFVGVFLACLGLSAVAYADAPCEVLQKSYKKPISVYVGNTERDHRLLTCVLLLSYRNPGTRLIISPRHHLASFFRAARGLVVVSAEHSYARTVIKAGSVPIRVSPKVDRFSVAAPKPRRLPKVPLWKKRESSR